MRSDTRVLALIAFFLLSCTLCRAGHGDRWRESDSSFIVRAGWFLPRGASDLWEQNEDLLTLRMADFNGVIGGFVMKLGLGENLNLGFGVDVYSKERTTRYVDFTDEDGYPIVQDLRLTLSPITVTAELLPFGRSAGGGARRRTGALRAIPYFGAGLGVYAYQYEEFGEQIDFRDFSIVDAQFISDGVAPGALVSGGVDFPIGRRGLFSVDARYHWVKTQLSGDFVGFEDFDLGGAQYTVGFGYRF